MDISHIEDYVGDCKGRTELDSHVDTCVGGATCMVEYYTGKTVSVTPFSGSYDPLNDIPVTSLLTAWTDLTMGMTYVVMLNEALYLGDRMQNVLLCPNQIRAWSPCLRSPETV